MRKKPGSDNMLKTILFPSSYFSIRNVDEDLKAEYDAVVETGLFDIVLFSYDKWFNEGELVLNQPIDEPCEAIYRGWMMKPEIYAEFYGQVSGLSDNQNYYSYFRTLYHCFN